MYSIQLKLQSKRVDALINMADSGISPS